MTPLDGGAGTGSLPDMAAPVAKVATIKQKISALGKNRLRLEEEIKKLKQIAYA